MSENGQEPRGSEGQGAPIQRAVALHYDAASSTAPRVVATGRGELAERILERARESGVPVQEDPDLVELLAACELGEEIPVELYTAVAQLLTFLYALNGEDGSQPGADPV